MRTRSIHSGDVVKVNKRGRLFHAHVRGEGPDGQLVVEPIERGVNYHHVGAREIVDHWRHARHDERDTGLPAEQYSFDHLLDR